MTKTMTDTVYALESQHYSRQRLMAVSRFYYPTFKKQMLFYFLLSVVLGLLGFYSSGHRTFTTMILGLLGTAQSFLLYWAPAVMIRENRETEVALPALWSEKFTVILVYFLVVIPVILYVPEMLIKSTLSGDWTFGMNTDLEVSRVFPGDAIWKAVAFGISSNLIPIIVSIFVVCACARPTFGKIVLWGIVATIAEGLLIGLGTGALLYYSDYVQQITGEVNVKAMLESIGFGKLLLTATAVNMCIFLLMCCLTARSVKNYEI